MTEQVIHDEQARRPREQLSLMAAGFCPHPWLVLGDRLGWITLWGTEQNTPNSSMRKLGAAWAGSDPKGREMKDNEWTDTTHPLHMLGNPPAVEGSRSCSSPWTGRDSVVKQNLILLMHTNMSMPTLSQAPHPSCSSGLTRIFCSAW